MQKVLTRCYMYSDREILPSIAISIELYFGVFSIKYILWLSSFTCMNKLLTLSILFSILNIVVFYMLNAIHVYNVTNFHHERNLEQQVSIECWFEYQPRKFEWCLDRENCIYNLHVFI
jgi:hypothetical protein